MRMRKRPEPAPKNAGGVRRPPAEHQFKKGQSGNPKGRPPKAAVSPLDRLRTAFESALQQPVRTSGPNGPTQLEYFDALAMAILQESLRTPKLGLKALPQLLLLIGERQALVDQEFEEADDVIAVFVRNYLDEKAAQERAADESGDGDDQEHSDDGDLQ